MAPERPAEPARERLRCRPGAHVAVTADANGTIRCQCVADAAKLDARGLPVTVHPDDTTPISLDSRDPQPQVRLG